MNYKIITVEGNIGSGKTSLAKKLAAEYNAKLILESFADNPFLQKFFEKQKDYALGTEMFFMAERFDQIKEELANWELFEQKIVIDYLFEKSLLYSKVNLDEVEYNLYQKIFNILNPKLPKSDLIIYLHSNTDRLVENIKKRGREFEQTVRKDYLQQIQDIYFEYFKQHPEDTIMVLDVSDADFVQNEDHYIQIKQIVESNLKQGINNFIIK
ncbi:MAG: deoxynucleoside kinase [Fimbriimonadaceae bacterium]|nr:deoxynucleoside kinase [Chitinophagales bacterium]